MVDVSKLLNQESALKYVVEYLKWKRDYAQDTRFGIEYGYSLYLPNVMRRWCREHHKDLGTDEHGSERFVTEISPYFYDACWELCRLGVLRPGVTQSGAQSTDDGSAGNGYSLTPFGRQWLEETNDHIFVPTEPQRFGVMLKPYAVLFGPGFHERANQAIRCYGAQVYLACCVMCGASAESVLLHLAITKEGDEAAVLKKYRAANGRKAIENIIIGSQKGGIKNDFEVCFGLLKYWRDEAAHGRKSTIKESEAYTSLALLLRCAQFAKDNYEPLTGKKQAT